MSCSDGTWHDLDYADATQSLPEVNNDMSFLTRNNITGPNNPPDTVAMLVSQHITIGFDGEMIKNNKIARKGNHGVIGTLLDDQENYNIFNVK